MAPLVSVIVVSYNSKSTVIETLDSIFSQTYSNIELIVSDDCSSDDTCKMVEQWIAAHSARFVRAELVCSEINTGVAANCNRGVRKSNGDFIKLLAADDLLTPFYCEKMVNAMISSEAEIACCYERVFYDSDIPYLGTEYESLLPMRPSNIKPFEKKGEELYVEILNACFIPAPTAFLRRELLNRLGGFDETYPLMEDYPLWEKAFKNNATIHFVDMCGVYYRKSEGSTSWRNKANATSVQKKFLSDMQRFMDEIVNPERILRGMPKKGIVKSLGESSVDEHKKEMEQKVIFYDLGKKLNDNKFQKKHSFWEEKSENSLKNLRIRNKKISNCLWHIQAYKERKLDIACKYKGLLRGLRKLARTECGDERRTVKRRIREEKRNYSQERKENKKLKKQGIARECAYFSFKNVARRYDRRVCMLSDYWRSIGVSATLCRLIKLGSPVAVYRKLRVDFVAELNSFVFKFAKKFAPRKAQEAILIRKLKNAIHNSLRYENDTRDPEYLKELAEKEVAFEKAYKKKEARSGPIHILFVVHLISAFSSVESIYRAMLEDERFEPTLLLIPKRQPGMENYYYYEAGLIERIMDSGYEYFLGYEEGKWTSIFSFEPEGVFFQTPYDIQRHPIYHCTERTAFPKIMYTPYGPWVMDKSVDDFIQSGVKPEFFAVAWRVFMDKLSLEMLEYAAPQHKEKCILTGSPKVDFNMQGLTKTSYCWKHPENSEKKRVIWMPRWGIDGGRTSFVDYYQQMIQLFEERQDIDFVFRPHPLLLPDLKRTHFFGEHSVEEGIAPFEGENSTIDYDCDYREGLLSCDFLIMDFSSIIYEYLPTGKPVIYTKKDNTLLDRRILEACYTVENWEDLLAVLNTLLSGEDPLKERRLEIVKELNYFPNNIANGENIKNYIAENIREEEYN